MKVKTLSLITSYKCTASCANCCFECNPNRQEKLTLSNAIKYINETLDTFKDIKVIVLTGGECFLDLQYLNIIIRYIADKQIVCRVVTNAFWAKTKEKAINILRECQNSGLNELNISTGDEHQQFVPFDYVKNAIWAASELNILTVLNVESGEGRQFGIKNILQDEDIKSIKKYNNRFKFHVVPGVWMPFTEEGLSKLKKRNNILPYFIKERCQNLFTGITISPDNQLYACCGLPVLYIPFLKLGCLDSNNLYERYISQFDDFLKIWLFVSGPWKILSFVGEKLKCDIPECHIVSHICFYCACLFTNSLYFNTAKRYYEEVYHSVMLKFSFILKQMSINK